MLGGGPSEGLLKFEALRLIADFVVRVLARLGERVAAWCACREFVGCTLPDARLRDCLTGGELPVAVLDPEDAVCAVREAGSLMGRVGDFGRGLMKPVWGGDGGILVFAGAPWEAVVGGLLAGFEVRLEAMDDALLSVFSTFFSGFWAGSFGVVGVLGVRGALSSAFLGDNFDAVVVFAVDIGGGLETVLLAPSAVFVAFLPLLCPFDVVEAAGFFSAVALSCFTGSFRSLLPLTTLVFDSSIALSGIVSSTIALFFLASISAAIDCFPSWAAAGLSSSSILKLGRLFCRLGSPLRSLFNPNCPPFLSTVTKLVRTFDSGRGELLALTLTAPILLSRRPRQHNQQRCIPIDSPGERPLSGGLRSLFCCSNMARRLRTPPDILLVVLGTPEGTVVPSLAARDVCRRTQPQAAQIE